MKKTTWLLCAAALITLAVLCTGCPIEADKVSQGERMEMFKNDVNAKAWGNLKGHTHSSAGMFAQADAAFWSNYFDGPGLFSYSVSGDSATASKDSINYTFDLKTEDKDIYKIYIITRAGNTIFQ